MLDDRAKLLLKALVERYIADGQPVGSRTLSRASGLDLSPATIRNVMADLEDLGLIASPHTSAGRVPTARDPPGERRRGECHSTHHQPATQGAVHVLAWPERRVHAAPALLSQGGPMGRTHAARPAPYSRRSAVPPARCRVRLVPFMDCTLPMWIRSIDSCMGLSVTPWLELRLSQLAKWI